jgi:hypothetical protein
MAVKRTYCMMAAVGAAADVLFGFNRMCCICVRRCLSNLDMCRLDKNHGIMSSTIGRPYVTAMVDTNRCF